MDFACGSGSLLLNVRKRMKNAGGTIGKIFGQEKNITTYNLARMNMLLHGVKDTEFEIYHGDTLTNDWDMLRETEPGQEAVVRRRRRQSALQLSLGAHRGAGRGRALQEPRPGPQVRRRLRLPAARLPLPQGRRRDGDHPAPRRAVPWRRRGTHPHQAAQRRPHRHCHRPAREPVLLHRHPGLHPRAQEVQEARRRALHQRRRALRERQTPEPADRRSTSRRSSRPTSTARKRTATPAGWRWRRSRRTTST